MLGDWPSLHGIARTLVPRAHLKGYLLAFHERKTALVWHKGRWREICGRRSARTPKPTGPTVGKAPAATAAFSLGTPAATSRQNRQRYSGCQTGGRPAEKKVRRGERSDFRLPDINITSNCGLLRRPFESA
ncbi:hypothetical protein GCM10011415_14480 [Salipiger pallidus]|uniref:Uncharacterized protein n=1 Tax=Salipiger pallidus TaxID=1775170 RepID=A0A8J2ZIN9_9RHOB|nr:hypothetical protein GCM10011415_14480 [Salipiger pallidus]